MYLLEATAAGTAGGSQYSMILMMVGVFALMYFMTIRPQKKRQKEEQEMRNAVDIGDEITTIGGIMGRVVTVKEDSLIIETGADRNKIRFRKSAIASVDKKYGEEKAPKGGYKVTGVKKSEKAESPIEAPALKEDK